MNPPLRSLAAFAAGLLCMEACFAAGAGKTPQPDSSPANTRVEATADASPPSSSGDMVVIPGPLRSFLRMTGISQEISPSDVMPMLARNVSLWGYTQDKPTEFLLLVERYVQLARELHSLAGADGIIRVGGCGDVNRLIQILGYQFQQGCGPDGASLMTADAERAFLTIDSGFPLTALEKALQRGTPFTYAFPATRVPVLFSEKAWTSL